MDPAIYSVAISYFVFGTLVGIASTVFLLQPTLTGVQQLKDENYMLTQEIEDLQAEAETMRAVRDLVDRAYYGDDEAEDEEEEVVPNLPPPPPIVRCRGTCLSDTVYYVSPVFTP